MSIKDVFLQGLGYFSGNEEDTASTKEEVEVSTAMDAVAMDVSKWRQRKAIEAAKANSAQTQGQNSTSQPQLPKKDKIIRMSSTDYSVMPPDHPAKCKAKNKEDCPYVRQKIKDNMEQGMDKETATQMALQYHNAPLTQQQQAQAEAQQQQGQQPPAETPTEAQGQAPAPQPKTEEVETTGGTVITQNEEQKELVKEAEALPAPFDTLATEMMSEFSQQTESEQAQTAEQMGVETPEDSETTEKEAKSEAQEISRENQIQLAREKEEDAKALFGDNFLEIDSLGDFRVKNPYLEGTPCFVDPRDIDLFKADPTLLETFFKSRDFSKKNFSKWLNARYEAKRKLEGQKRTEAEKSQEAGQGKEELPSNVMKAANGMEVEIPDAAMELVRVAPDMQPKLQAMIDALARSQEEGLSPEAKREADAAFEAAYNDFYALWPESERAAGLREGEEQAQQPQEESPQEGETSAPSEEEKPQESAQPQQTEVSQETVETRESQPSSQEQRPSEQQPPRRPLPTTLEGIAGMAEAPDDREFSTGKKGEYRIGDATYVDLSGRGLFGQMLGAIWAGLNGKQILTDFDRVSGKWDALKTMSKPRGMLRDSIRGSALNSEIGEALANENLDASARDRLSVIKEMMDNARTPAEKIKALNQYDKWKEQFGGGTALSDIKPSSEFNMTAGDDWQGELPNATRIFNPPSVKESNERLQSEIREKVDALMGRLGINASVEHIANAPTVMTVTLNTPEGSLDKLFNKETARQLNQALETEGIKLIQKGGKTRFTVTKPKADMVEISEAFSDPAIIEKAKKMQIPMITGKDENGNFIVEDLAKSPHMLISGATGSGKSVDMNAGIATAIALKSPQELGLFIIDGKGQEFPGMAKLPHLIHPVVNGVDNPKGVKSALLALQKEMHDRQNKMAGVKSIDVWNAQHPDDKIKPIMAVIDEYAALQDQDPSIRAILDDIGRLARSTGIHMKLATQAPNKKLMDTLRSHFPLQHVYKSADKGASLATLGSAEGTGLTGNGDGYVVNGDNKTRIRGTFVSDDELGRLVEHYTGEFPEEYKKPGASRPTETTSTASSSERSTSESMGYDDAITAAKEKNRPVALPNIEGLEDHMRQSLPGWNIEKEEFEGDTYIKATPPSQTSIPQTAEQSTSATEEENANSAQEESQQTEAQTTSTGSGQETTEQTTAKRPDLSTKEGYLQAAQTEYDNAIDAARQQYEEDGNLDAYEDATDEAEEVLNKRKERAEKRFPSQKKPTETPSPSGQETQKEEAKKPVSSYEAMMTPEVRNNRVDNWLRDQKKALLAQHKGADYSPEYQAAERRLHDRSDRWRQMIEEGKSEEEIAETFKQEDKTESDRQAAEKKAQTDRDAALKAKATAPVRGKPLAGSIANKYRGNPEAYQRLNKQGIARVQSAMPEGWQMDESEEHGGPVKDGFGKTYVRHPSNGSFGYVDNTGFHMVVDTTHPDFKGPASQEAEQYREEWKKAKPGSVMEKDMRKKFMNAAYGIDEMPEGITFEEILEQYAVAFG